MYLSVNNAVIIWGCHENTIFNLVTLVRRGWSWGQWQQKRGCLSVQSVDLLRSLEGPDQEGPISSVRQVSPGITKGYSAKTKEMTVTLMPGLFLWTQIFSLILTVISVVRFL